MAVNKEPYILDKTIKSIPLILGILTFLSYSNLHYFYREFGIEIYEFLSISELLLLFLPKVHSVIIYILGSVFIFIFIILFPLKHQETTFSKKKTNRTIKQYWNFLNTSTIKRLGLKLTIKVIFNITILLWRVLILFLLFFLIIEGSKQGWFHPCPIDIYNDFLFWIFMALLYLFIHLIKSASTQKTIKSILIFIVIGYFTMWAIKHRSICKASAIKERLEIKNVSLILNKEKITTSNDTVYIGGVQNYVFLYDILSKQTIIYQKNDIKIIQIKNSDNNNL